MRWALRALGRFAAARLAYAFYREWTASERWQSLVSRGARPQRLLWASTSTKDPAYADTKYVEALIGPQTINTMPHATLEAYRDHGQPAPRLMDDVDGARAVRSDLQSLDIDLEDLSDRLEREGIQKFIEPYDKLAATLAERAGCLRLMSRVGAHLPRTPQ